MILKLQMAGNPPRGDTKLLTYLLLTLLLSTYSLTRSESIEHGTGNKSVPRSGPKDYAYSPTSSRVRDLASFFEAMSRDNHDDPEERKKQNVIISLSEAASKLHVLSAGYPLDIKCSKYVKLITRPNIRTFATINLLMKEQKLFNEMEQTDANLVAKLANERSFDALGKLQTFIQTLESERENMRSVFEPDVQKDFLDCMNYYIYRHQRAISGITYHVREQRNKLSPVIAQPAGTEVALRKFQEIVDDTLNLEADSSRNDDCDPMWIANLSKLHSLVLENHLEVPVLVQEFVTNSKRLTRLAGCDRALNAVENLKQQVLELETGESGSRLNESPEYKLAMVRLREFSKSENELLRNETLSFINESNRLLLLDDHAKVEPHISSDTDNPKQVKSTVPEIETLNPTAHNKLLSPKVVKLQTPEASDESSKKQEVSDGISPDGTNSDNHEPVNLSKELCPKLSVQLSDNLRLISWKALDSDHAKKLAKGLNDFQIDCASERSFISPQSRWSIVSMTKKLSDWCLAKLRNPSLADSDRRPLLSILELLHRGYKMNSIKPKGV